MTGSRTDPRRSQGVAFGFIGFAAVMMIILGILHAFMGFVAIVQGEFYVRSPDYLLDVDTTVWGWIHLVAGLVVLAAGFGVLTGKAWARGVGIAVASLSLLLNFAFLPYYPLWALLVLAFDVCVIWALADHGPDFPVRDSTRGL